MSTLKEQVLQLQEQRIQEIINDPNLNKLEKLKLFTDENLFKIEDFIQDRKIFSDWCIELENKVKEEKNRDYVFIDTFLSPAKIDYLENKFLEL